MAALDQIINWAKTLPAWQKEAVRRLLQQQSLTPEDEADIFAMLQVANGANLSVDADIAVPELPDFLAAQSGPKRRVVLRKMTA